MQHLSLYLDGEKVASIPYDLTDKSEGYQERKVAVLKAMRPAQLRECNCWEIVIEGVPSKTPASKKLTETDKATIRRLYGTYKHKTELAGVTGFSRVTIGRILKTTLTQQPEP